MTILLDSVFGFLCISFLFGLFFSFLVMGKIIEWFDRDEKKEIFLNPPYYMLLLTLFGALVMAFFSYMSHRLSCGELALCLAGGYNFAFVYMLFGFKRIKIALVQLIPVLVMSLYILLKIEFLLIIALTLVFIDVVIKYYILKIFKNFFNF